MADWFLVGRGYFDLISLGFINSPDHRKLIDESKPLRDVRLGDYDGALFVGGQGVRDGHLITGHQQCSGSAAARLLVEALGV